MKNALIIVFAVFCFMKPALAQEKTGNQDMDKMLELSRPGSMHQVLKQIAGAWKFQDKKLAFVKGTLVRTSRYDDRFFDVEITGGKLKLPVSGGMKEDSYRSFQLEGYDNARKTFVTISVNNHIGSDIQEQTGTYDPEKKQLSYEWESELLPGQKVRNRRVLTIVDADHYTEKYYAYRNNAFELIRELDYSH